MSACTRSWTKWSHFLRLLYLSVIRLDVLVCKIIYSKTLSQVFALFTTRFSI
jgi:hypothetical protein